MNLQEAVQRYFGTESAWNIERLPSTLLVQELSVELRQEIAQALTENKRALDAEKFEPNRGALQEKRVALVVAQDCLDMALADAA